MTIVCLSERQYGCGASIAGYRLALALAGAGHEVHWWYARPFDGPLPEPARLWQRQLPAAPALRRWEGALARISVRCWGFFLRQRWRKNEAGIHDGLTDLAVDAVILNNIDSVLNHAGVRRLADRLPVYWLIHSNLALQPWHYQFERLDGALETAYSYPPALVDTAAQRSLVDHPQLRFVAPSNWLARHNRAIHGDRLRISVIPYAIDPSTFYPEKKLKKPASRLRILLVASQLAYPRKNIQLLLAALPRLDAERYHFLALGRDSDGLAERYPMIEFLTPSYRPEVLRQHYSNADYFLMPSLIDNLPNTVLESLLCGTPVIGSRTGGVPDMVLPGTSGLLFDPYSVDELVGVLRRLVTSPPPLLRDAALHRWAAERYAPARIAEQWTDLLEKRTAAT